MVATPSAWSTKPGAWALDAEEHEEELRQQRKAMDESNASAADFPSLSAAKGEKKKKKKGQTLSLAEFTTYAAPKANQGPGLTPGELLNLPTGPRERTAEEMDASRIGGGFRSYGMGRSGGGDGDRWGPNRGSDEPRRPREPLGPSRADEIDNWAAGKKPVAFGNGGGFDRRERSGGSFFGSDSKADEADSWVSKKSFTPSDPPRRFGSGAGFDRERRSYEPFTPNGGAAADSDSWMRRNEENGHAAFTGGRPKLNLQPRTLPLDRPQSPNAVAVKPQSPDVVKPQSPLMVKPRSFNPFGEARPREEVLAEKGQDWKEIDEQLESMKLKEVGSARPRSSRGWRGCSGEEKTERSWRKSIEDARPTSAGDKTAEKIEENGSTEEK